MTDLLTRAAPCTDCGRTVVHARLLTKDRHGNVHPAQVRVDLRAYLPARESKRTLLLHLGNDREGRWLLVSMDDPGARRAAEFVGPRAHCHSPHVCDKLPAEWWDTLLEPADEQAGTPAGDRTPELVGS